MARKLTLTPSAKAFYRRANRMMLDMVRTAATYSEARAILEAQDNLLDEVIDFRRCGQFLGELEELQRAAFTLMLLRFPGYYTAHIAANRAIKEVR